MRRYLVILAIGLLGLAVAVGISTSAGAGLAQDTAIPTATPTGPAPAITSTPPPEQVPTTPPPPPGPTPTPGDFRQGPGRPEILEIQTGPTWMAVEWEPFPGVPETGENTAHVVEVTSDETEPPTEWTYGFHEPELGIAISLSDLEANTLYRVRIGSWTGVGYKWSPVAEARTKPATIPAPPGSFVVDSGYPAQEMFLAWKPAWSDGGASVTSYRIEWSLFGDDPWKLVTEIPAGPGLHYSDYGTDDVGPVFHLGEHPFYRVAGISEVGVGHFTEPTQAVRTIASIYDANGNGKIERAELVKAINDYLFGEGHITKDDVITLINIYLYG